MHSLDIFQIEHEITRPIIRTIPGEIGKTEYTGQYETSIEKWNCVAYNEEYAMAAWKVKFEWRREVKFIKITELGNVHFLMISPIGIESK